ncbi:MAG: pyruvate kinase [Chlamydia sp. 32-24]|nr:MAG: pyruvate kinase [Chlamydia sp. 32-24]
MARTKIICTIGPSVQNYDKICALIDAGMNVARLNFSHGTHDEHQRVIDLLKSARREKKVPLAIMLDTKGPEIRVGKIKNGFIDLHKGQKLFISAERIEGDDEQFSIHPSQVIKDFRIGTKILFDDGYISSHVIKVLPEGVWIEIDNGGTLKSGKGVNVPYASLNLPAITDQDIEDIIFGCKNDVDIIAASFVRSASHVLVIKDLLAEQKKSNILVLAKIENNEGVQNFDHIIQIADGIMIARGDLGVEVPFSQVPSLQKMMIRKCYFAGKSSVTATQMLESMINNPRPTRAEASDVANAIYDSTSAVMLSGETAVGKYPLETVATMRSIIEEAEKEFNYTGFFEKQASIVYLDVPSSITSAAVKTAYSSNAQTIFTCTSGGSTARSLARFRPKMPIIALTHDIKTYNQLALAWGVTPVYSEPCATISEAFGKLSQFALERELLHNGDLVVLTAGTPFGISGTTNMMMVENIGEVLVRGHSGVGKKIHGNIVLVFDSESIKTYEIKNKIIVITKCDETYMPLIQESLGVILQNQIEDLESEHALIDLANRFNKPAIIRADTAMKVLKNGQLVTLDPEKSLIYKGVVLDI